METDVRAVSRDWPGEVVDQIETVLPGATALYLQGTCGDVNFRREFNGTDRRYEPAKALTKAALEGWQNSRPLDPTEVQAITRKITLPTRRWRREEILRERDEGLYRLNTSDTTGWLEGVADSWYFWVSLWILYWVAVFGGAYYLAWRRRNQTSIYNLRAERLEALLCHILGRLELGWLPLPVLPFEAPQAARPRQMRVTSAPTASFALCISL